MIETQETEVKELKPINPVNQLLVDTFLNDKSKDKSQTSVYMKLHPECTYQTAVAKASLIFNRPEVKEYLRIQLSKASYKAQVTPERIIREWANRAFFNPTSVFNSEYKLLRPQDMDKRTQRMLIGINFIKWYELEEQGGTYEQVLAEVAKCFKVIHKDKALENLTRINGMYQDKVDLTSKGERIKIDIVYTNNVLNVHQDSNQIGTATPQIGQGDTITPVEAITDRPEAKE